MRLLITGGTGFIGTRLCSFLLSKKCDLILLVRDPKQAAKLTNPKITCIERFTDLPLDSKIDCVINLAGEPIADKRWSKSRKQQLLDSRVELTESLVRALAHLHHRPKLMISASAVGYYGDQGSSLVTEATPPNLEFTHELCKQWEMAAGQAKGVVDRLVILRLGPVLGPRGGMLKKMLGPFKMGLGGNMGSGKQYLPWVHIEDVIRFIIFTMKTRSVEGIYNMTAPYPVSNEAFTYALAQLLEKPAFLHLPEFFLKAAFGEMSRLLLTGQKAVPARIQETEFEFKYPELIEALEASVSK